MKTIGNFTNQATKQFPIDCETFAALQTNIALCAALGRIIGGNAILTGCEADDEGKRGEGYLYIQDVTGMKAGDIVYYGGGTGDYVHISDTSESVTAGGILYQDAYTTRTATSDENSLGGIAWQSFIDAHGVLIDLTTNVSSIKETVGEMPRAFFYGVLSSYYCSYYEGIGLQLIDYDIGVTEIGTTPSRYNNYLINGFMPRIGDRLILFMMPNYWSPDGSDYRDGMSLPSAYDSSDSSFSIQHAAVIDGSTTSTTYYISNYNELRQNECSRLYCFDEAASDYRELLSSDIGTYTFGSFINTKVWMEFVYGTPYGGAQETSISGWILREKWGGAIV